MLRFGSVLLFLLVLSLDVNTQSCIDTKEKQCPFTTDVKTHINQDDDWKMATSIYDFYVYDIHGNNVSLSKYRGHVALIVNVASNCGLTDTNYKQLVQLHEKYSNTKGLRILAFPSNEFGGQEPGTPQQILDFIKIYNVNFDVFEKVSVNGEQAHPLWKWLKTQASGFMTDAIKWNFSKFVIDKNGKVVSRFSPMTEPLEIESILNALF